MRNPKRLPHHASVVLSDEQIVALDDIAARWSDRDRSGERVSRSRVIRVLLARAIAAERST